VYRLIQISDCRTLDILSRLWPEKAAEKVETHWKGAFHHMTNREDHWNEIRDNVREGNVTGSGEGYTLLHAFVTEGNKVATKYLLDNGMDVNAKTNTTNETALHAAIQHQKLELCQLLLANGSDVFLESNAGISPWALAVSSSKTTILEVLAEHTTSTNILFPGPKGPHKSPLGIAIVDAKNTSALKLIERGIKIGAKKAAWSEVLLFAAETGGAITEIVKSLLELGARANHRSPTGRTSLMAASVRGDEKLVELLLKKRQDLEVVDFSQHTALSLAAEKGFDKIVKLLLDAGAKVDGYPRDRAPDLITRSPQVLALLRKKQRWKKTWFHQPRESVPYSDMVGG
jgi:ankyrin repeat protein